MKQRAAVGWLITTLVLTALVLGLTLSSGNVPLLGLDLQGGVSVVLEPAGEVDSGRLEQAKDIVARRVDGLGVAEPEISIQGNNILVQIPGIDDPDRALELVGQTAELRFRPVLRQEAMPAGLEDLEVPTTLDPDATTLPTDTTDTTVTDGATTVPGSDTTLESTPSTAPPTTAPATTGAGENEAGMALTPGENAAAAQSPDATDEAGAPASTGTTLPATSTPATLAPPTGGPTTVPPAPEVSTGLLADAELTPRAEDTVENTVILAQYNDDGEEIARYELGPAAMTGQALDGAQAVLDPASSQWTVTPQFKSGSPGIDDLNAIAPACVSFTPECPTGQLAIVLDEEVISAPSIEQPSFEADSIQISGSFTEREAKDLALVLRYGALPVVLEPQAAQIVSATVGDDALRAGIIAGLAGLALASLYMFLMYRLLGLVAIATLSMTAVWLYALVTWLSDTRGLALTLAGVTGLIVSIGTSLDSNIVYFEHLKEDVRNGRSLRSAVERSFASSFRTIIAADMVSLIGAAILYWLTVGAVRGFALFLGLSTIFDLIATWFFLRPTVILMGRSRRFQAHPKLLAMPTPDEPASSAENRVAPEPAGVS